MQWTLNMLDEFGNVVQGEARFEVTEITRRYFEGPPRGGDMPARQPPAECLVYNLAKRPPDAP